MANNFILSAINKKLAAAGVGGVGGTGGTGGAGNTGSAPKVDPAIVTAVAQTNMPKGAWTKKGITYVPMNTDLGQYPNINPNTAMHVPKMPVGSYIDNNGNTIVPYGTDLTKYPSINPNTAIHDKPVSNNTNNTENTGNTNNVNNADYNKDGKVDYTDMIFKSWLDSNGGENAFTSFQDYMKTWTPDMSADDFVKLAGDAATVDAQSQYNANSLALKTAYNNKVGGYNTQLAKIPGQYEQQYADNEAGQYSDLQAIKSALARRNLAGTGIELGNNLRTLDQYAKSKQKIDTDVNDAKNDINTQISAANTTYNDALAGESTKQNDFVASAKVKARQDYLEYMTGEKKNASDNFWKGMGYELDKTKTSNDLLNMIADYGYKDKALSQDQAQFDAKMEQQAKEFAATNKLEYDKLSQEDKQFYYQMAQEQTQFEDQLKQENDQFIANHNLDKAKLKESSRQFDAQLGLDAEKVANDYTIAKGQLDSMNWQNKFEWKKFENEKTEFAKSLEQETAKFSMDEKRYYQDENARVDNTVIGLIKDYETKYPDGNDDVAVTAAWRKKIMAVLDSSGLSDGMKTEKIKMISESVKTN